ncbi:MAG: hypothetical protein WD025_02830 [Bacteriovoracaceae bacterium]
MLSSIQEYPIIGMSVLTIFALLFGYIIFETLRNKNKEAFQEAARMPLEEQERL